MLSESIEYLGVLIDKHMTLEGQINRVVSSSYYELKKIKSIRKYLSIDDTAQLIHAFISSKLDYCNALYLGLPSYLITKLQRVQNAAMRVLLKLNKYVPVAHHLFQQHWLPIERRIVFKNLTIVFKCIHALAPIPLMQCITLRDDYRTSFTLKRTFYPKNMLDHRAFAVFAPILWNNLPLNLRSNTVISSFKSSLKTFLFSEFFDYKQRVNMIIKII